jgi:hypothetical protein
MRKVGVCETSATLNLGDADTQTASRTFRFPLDKPLPAALLTKIAKVRLTEKPQKKQR